MAQELFDSTTPEDKKKNKTWIIVVVIVVLLCCLCLAVAGAGLWLWNNGDRLLEQLGLFLNLVDKVMLV